MGYMGMCAVKGMVFKLFTLTVGYMNQSVWVQNGISFFRKLISWLKIFSDLGSFWKTAALGQGGFGEFTLVQDSKLQLSQLCYRLRVPGSKRRIPTQKFLKYPPPPGLRDNTELYLSCLLICFVCFFLMILSRSLLASFPFFLLLPLSLGFARLCDSRISSLKRSSCVIFIMVITYQQSMGPAPVRPASKAERWAHRATQVRRPSQPSR